MLTISFPLLALLITALWIVLRFSIHYNRKYQIAPRRSLQGADSNARKSGQSSALNKAKTYDSNARQDYKADKVDWKEEFLHALSCLYLIMVARFTMFPFFLVDGAIPSIVFDPKAILPFWINYIPIQAMSVYLHTVQDVMINVVGNILMFMPAGFLWPVLWHKLDKLPRIVGAGFLFSLLIELVQLLFPERMSDVDDLILNTLGCLAGYGVLLLVKKLWRKRL